MGNLCIIKFESGDEFVTSHPVDFYGASKSLVIQDIGLSFSARENAIDNIIYLCINGHVIVNKK